MMAFPSGSGPEAEVSTSSVAEATTLLATTRLADGYDSENENDEDDWGFDPSNTEHRFDSFETGPDLFEETKTNVRNGATTLSSLSEFTELLARLGLRGPRHLPLGYLRRGALRIGEGSQFTVSKLDDIATAGLVVKRVHFGQLDRSGGEDPALNPRYREHLKTLQLEVLSLCHPKLRNHRNIVKLVAWGYDYDDQNTSVPVLFVEAALCTLSKFLEDIESRQSELAATQWDIRQHLALDTAAGLAVIHQLRITHGDVKPDNILIFKQDNQNVPYLAKLSDFGVCLDMQSADTAVTPDSYGGTDMWVGPEARIYDPDTHGAFSPDSLFKFESYSYGLLVLSIFVTAGAPPLLERQREDGEGTVDVAVRLLREKDDFPLPLRQRLVTSLRGLLAERPSWRPLPDTELLKTATKGYFNWVLASETTATRPPEYDSQDLSSQGFHGRQGLSYWKTLDPQLLRQLDAQYAQSSNAPFPPETLFGLAHAFAATPGPTALQNTIKYVYAAASAGHSPALAICGNICAVTRSEDGSIKLDPETERSWLLNAVSEGFLFPREGVLSSKMHAKALADFRDRGGYCTSKFLNVSQITTITREEHGLRRWVEDHGVEYAVDSDGNSMLHVAAALGNVGAVHYLLEHMATVDMSNDNGETALYLACQSGHADLVRFLLDHDANASSSTKDAQLTALHWLFTFDETDIAELGKNLVKRGADVNAQVFTANVVAADAMTPIICQHYPFQWPFGTPLHWATFARCKVAITTLLELGANIEAVYPGAGSLTTPLALSAQWGAPEIVQLLISKGADAKVTDAKGRNILHNMSVDFTHWALGVGKKFQFWVQHGHWDDRLSAIREICRLLVDANTEVDRKPPGSYLRVPVKMASREGPPDSAIIWALLELGAKPDEMQDEYDWTVLHIWAGKDARSIDYPSAHDLVIEKIVEKTADLNQMSNVGTPLHHLMASDASLEQVQRVVKRLVTHPSPASLEVQNRNQLNPLLFVIGSSKDPIQRAKVLLEFGARPDFTTTDGENIVSEAIGNASLMDDECCSIIEHVVSLISSEKRLSFVLSTSTKALHQACHRGLYSTVRCLLEQGLSSRVNESGGRGAGHTALDHALRGANGARTQFISRASDYRRGPQREKAIEDEVCFGAEVEYAPDAYGGGGENRAREREAYWAFPRLIELLRSYDAARSSASISGTDPPALFDASTSYMLGFYPDEQPHKRHWEILYTYQDLGSDFRGRLVESLQSHYDDDRIWPRLVLLEMYPEILEVRGQGQRGKGWVEALLMDDTPVEARIAWGKVEEIRDLAGKVVDPSQR